MDLQIQGCRFTRLFLFFFRSIIIQLLERTTYSRFTVDLNTEEDRLAVEQSFVFDTSPYQTVSQQANYVHIYTHALEWGITWRGVNVREADLDGVYKWVENYLLPLREMWFKDSANIHENMLVIQAAGILMGILYCMCWSNSNRCFQNDFL